MKNWNLKISFRAIANWAGAIATSVIAICATVVLWKHGWPRVGGTSFV
jgi:hypothetical protein